MEAIRYPDYMMSLSVVTTKKKRIEDITFGDGLTAAIARKLLSVDSLRRSTLGFLSGFASI